MAASSASRSPGVSPTPSPPIANAPKPSAAVRAALSARSSAEPPPCTIPNRSWSARRCVRRPRSAQRRVRSRHARVRPCSGSPGRISSNSSSTTIRSAPSRSWISTARSGDRNTERPSSGLLNSTPSSLRRQNASSENTWKPPESVSIGPSQPMNPCSPPCAATSSSPGPQVQVIGVREHALHADPRELVGREPAHRAERRDREERRRLEDAVRREQPSRARLAVARAELEARRAGALSGSTARPRRSRSGSRARSRARRRAGWPRPRRTP